MSVAVALQTLQQAVKNVLNKVGFKPNRGHMVLNNRKCALITLFRG